MAAAQSAGAIGAIAVAYGWNLTGPVLVAEQRNSHREHQRLWYEFIASSTLLYAVTAPALGAILLFVAPPGYRAVCAMIAAATALAGVTPNWYGVGSGRPSLVVLYNTAPRVLALIVALPILVLTHSLYAYPIAIGTGAVLGVSAFTLRECRPLADGREFLACGVNSLRRHRSAAITSATAGSYSAGTLFMVGLFATPLQTTRVASIDKLFRLGIQTLSVSGQTLQSWVMAPDPAVSARRKRQSIVLHLSLGVAGLATLTAAGPAITGLWFGEANRAGGTACALYGVGYLFLALSTSLGNHVLLPAGRTRQVLRSTMAGALLGVPAIAIGAHMLGANGAAGGFALSEVVVAFVQAAIVFGDATNRRTLLADA